MLSLFPKASAATTKAQNYASRRDNGPRVNPSEAVRGASMSEKRKQGLKKRLLDPEQDSDDEEIRYLAKLKV
ncbi:hypothetical protein HID58_003952 [Brassica napus]|uniref:Uncharacterized protein n=1 Tax=Brassica napus TaxID=3708 RepID=A0ABQ7XKS0_BRANA|nr:hypothetical protein HID58_003952 [Brassica napus]